MLRTTTLLAALFATLFTTLVTTGCDQRDTGIVWYDDGLDACFSDNDGGKTVEVPCDQDDIIAEHGSDACFIILSNKTIPASCDEEGILLQDEFGACFIILSNGIKTDAPCDAETSKNTP